MNALWWEKWHPVILAVTAVAAWCYFKPTFPFENNDLLNATLNLSAILTGFLATAKALLITLDTPVMQRISKAGYIEELAKYMSNGIYFSFALCLLTLVGYFLPKNKPEWFIWGWIFLCVASSLAFLRISRVLVKLLARKGPEF